MGSGGAPESLTLLGFGSRSEAGQCPLHSSASPAHSSSAACLDGLRAVGWGIMVERGDLV